MFPLCYIVPKKELVCVFPFLGRKSLEIKKRLQNAIERTLSYCKLKVIFKSPSKIVHHFHFKDVLPKKLCSGIAYSFKCNNCNAIYYGKTKRHFYVRAAEHMGILHLRNKRLKNVKQSAISDHALTCHCNINFNDFTILSMKLTDRYFETFFTSYHNRMDNFHFYFSFFILYLKLLNCEFCYLLFQLYQHLL